MAGVRGQLQRLSIDDFIVIAFHCSVILLIAFRRFLILRFFQLDYYPSHKVCC